MQTSEDAEDNVSNLLREFRESLESTGAVTSDHSKCQRIFSELKMILINFQLLPPFPKNNLATIRKQLAFARETYELGAFLSIERKDEKSFERYVANLKTYYFDYSSLLPDSERKWQILGLHLMSLLAQNMISEFHTELELVPLDNQRLTNYISFPIELERWIMEGSYNKVLSATSSVPLPVFSFFMDKLMVTVRQKMADCIEKAYETFPIDEAAVFLNFEEKKDEFIDYCKKRNWEIKDEISFKQGKNEVLDIPAHKTIKQSLLYASELERIV